MSTLSFEERLRLFRRDLLLDDHTTLRSTAKGKDKSPDEEIAALRSTMLSLFGSVASIFIALEKRL